MRNATAYFLLICSLFLGSAFGKAKSSKPRVIRMHASAFARNAKPTSSGTVAHEGIVAADPAVLPLGSRIRINGAGTYNGIYTVTDTGGKISGNRIDLYVPTAAEAKQFGRKVVTVHVLERGKGKEDARAKDVAAPKSKR